MDMMETIELKDIESQVKQVFRELLEAARLKPGQLLVVGCSSSEIDSFKIGSHSNGDIGMVVYTALNEECRPLGIYLAAQCCEHLNRALILEEEAALKYGYDPVNVVPQLKAGGSFAKAHAGIDIGDTLIGMHLKDVAVPVRIQTKEIGSARVVCARTRPKFIGGIRARYDEENM